MSYAVFCLKKNKEENHQGTAGSASINGYQSPQPLRTGYLSGPKHSLKSLHALSYRSCFFFNDTVTTEIYTLSLHDALPIYGDLQWRRQQIKQRSFLLCAGRRQHHHRSEEHTSEPQSLAYLVCRLLLEK